MVIGYHLSQHHYFPESKLLRYMGMSVFNGPLAVNIFFIISGFLITLLLQAELIKDERVSLKQFYIRRSIRIFPAYYFILFIYFCLQLAGYLSITKLDWISMITFTKQFIPFTINETAHLWSLSVEQIFYFLWPLIFILSKDYKVVIVLVLILLITTLRVINYQYPLPSMTNSIFSTGDALLVGCLIALLYDKIKLWVVEKPIIPFLIIPLLLLSLITNFYLYHLTEAPSLVPKGLLMNIIQPISYSLLGTVGLLTNILVGLGVVYCINSAGLIYRILNLPIMNHIGKLSYSIYLWQQLFTSDIAIMHKFPIIVLLLFIYTAALISYKFIERPFLLLKRT